MIPPRQFGDVSEGFTCNAANKLDVGSWKDRRGKDHVKAFFAYPTCPTLCPHSFDMAAGIAFSEDLRAVIIHMHTSCNLDAKSISHLSGIPRRTIFNILAEWRRTGEVKPAPEGTRGRPRALDFADTQVCAFV